MTGDIRTPPCLCPACGALLSGAGPADGSGPPPEPGDFSCCIRCGELLRFQPDMRVRALTDADRAEIAADPDLAKELTLNSLTAQLARELHPPRKERAH